MLLKIIQTGDDCLRREAKTVSVAQLRSRRVQELIDLMIATLRDQPGVGLAAPQVGESLRIVVIEDRKEYHGKLSLEALAARGRRPVALEVIINPVLTVIDPTEVRFFEGCLSVSGYFAVVPRAAKVRVTGLDRHGKPIALTAEGWLARMLQHETDHLGGGLHIDKMYPRTFSTEEQYSRKWASATPEEIDVLLQLDHRQQ